MKDLVDKNKYVVLDVETNGLHSEWDDLLSISIFRPDTNEYYDRLLPLELNKDVYTTWINGITKKDLKGMSPLSQDEIDRLIRDFGLNEKIILTYGRIDRVFLRKYFERHNLKGLDCFKFYDFKRSIISSPFSGGAITKDSLCRVFGINGVRETHSGKNDCLLEWQLFEKMNGGKLFVDGAFRVYRFDDDYIVPASYLARYANFKYHSNSCVDVIPQYRFIKRFKVRSDIIEKFETNINGIAIEHLLSVLLDAKDYKKEEKEKFLLDNKKKLELVGKIPSPFNDLLIEKNDDGSLRAVKKEDQDKIRRINLVLEEYKKGSVKLVNFLKSEIFKNKSIRYQELVVKPDKKTLALCDFSSEDSILEMKAYGALEYDDKLPIQMYYQSDGREMYVLTIEWFDNGVDFVISKVETLDVTEKKIRPIIFQYKTAKKKASVRRKEKEHKEKKPKEAPLTEEQKREKRLERYKNRISELSGGTIEILYYIDSRSNTEAKCLKCGHVWSARSDKIADRGCPNCRKMHN